MTKHPKKKRSGSTHSDARDKRIRYVAIGLGSLAFLLYVNTLGHQFVLDDPLAIEGNAFVTKGIAGIPDILTHHYRAGTEGAGSSALLYRPLSLVSFAIEWSIVPGSPVPGHLMNVLWFVATVLLLFSTLRMLFFRYHWFWPAGAALLFAIHPIHTEVVANIKSRDELMSLFFAIAGLYYWCRWLRDGGRHLLVAALGTYFLALLSKESAITMLPLYPLAGWVFYGQSARASLRAFMIWCLPVAGYLLIRAVVLAHAGDPTAISAHDNPIVDAHGMAERTATGFMVLWKYVQLLVVPYPLVSDYSYRALDVVRWSHWQAIAGLVLYTGLSAYAIHGLVRRKPLAFLTASYLASILLFSQLLIVIGTLFGERLAYFASVWFCAAIAFLVCQSGAQDILKIRKGTHMPGWSEARVPMSIFAIISVLMGSLTIIRNAEWRSNYTLFSADVATSPTSVRLQNGLAGAAITKFNTETLIPEADRSALLVEAEQHAQTALAIRDNFVSHIHLGNVAGARKQFAKAIQQYEAASDLVPGNSMASINLGRTYRAWGQDVIQSNMSMTQGITYLEKAIGFGENDALIYLNLGAAYGSTGDHVQAIRNFEKATELDPDNAMIWNNLAKAYRTTGQTQKAVACEQKAAMLRE